MRIFSIRRARGIPLLPGALEGCFQTFEITIRTVVGISRTLGLEGVELEQELALPPLQGGAGRIQAGLVEPATAQGFAGRLDLALG